MDYEGRIGRRWRKIRCSLKLCCYKECMNINVRNRSGMVKFECIEMGGFQVVRLSSPDNTMRQVQVTLKRLGKVSGRMK